MNDKTQIITALRDEFNRWEELLTGISQEQITAPNFVADRSIKDIVAHLTVWQQISVARMEAARHNRKPEYPKWPPELDHESDADLDQINAWIFERYRELPWSNIHQEWKERFLHFLELAELIPEKDLFDTEKYPWLNGYPLSTVLLGSYEHHKEHFDPLLGLLRQHGNMKFTK